MSNTTALAHPSALYGKQADPLRIITAAASSTQEYTPSHGTNFQPEFLQKQEGTHDESCRRGNIFWTRSLIDAPLGRFRFPR